MALPKSRSREFAIVGVTAALLWLVFAGTPGFAQSPPLLQITSPADGSVVHPGDTVTVVVTPAKGVTFAMVALFGEGGLTKDQVLASPPYQFSLTIPKNISTARKYQIRADGAISPGQGGASPAISLDVEPAASCVKVTVQPNHIDLDAVDLPYRLQVSCTFADGASMYITDSTQIRYTSFNTAVAAVDQNGQVRLVGPGRTTVMANFGGQMDGTLIDVAKPAPAAPQAVATGGAKAQAISSRQSEAGGAAPAQRTALSLVADDTSRSVRISGPKNLTDLGKGKYSKWVGCSYSIQWGDGSGWPAGPNGADCRLGLSHTYKDAGTYRIVGKTFHLAPNDSPVDDWVGEAQFVVK